MEANELRLGNLVTIDNEKNWAKLKNIPLKITAINQLQDLEGSKNGVSLEHLVQLPNTYYETYSQYLHFIKPIELNEAWLKSFGFKPFSKDFQKNAVIIHTRKRGFVVNTKIPVLKYVHQLQNLYYALRGEELS
jgi:hypothetical protein